MSTENTLDAWDERFKKEHPVSYWIDNSLFKRVNGICDVAPHHFLSHPWILFTWSWERIVWAWQRVFRGWDDRVTWDVSYYLSEMIPVWLEQMKSDKVGVPIMMFSEDDYDKDDNYNISPEASERASQEYDDIIQKIALGFLANKKIQDAEYDYMDDEDKEYNELYSQFEEGFDLFKEYFNTLND